MKNLLWKILLVVMVLVAVASITVTAADYTFNIAVDGYQNYDETNEILSYVNGYRAEVGAAPLKMEPALMELANRCDAVVVIGSANSSNTRALEKLAREAGCSLVARVNGAEEIP